MSYYSSRAGLGALWPENVENILLGESSVAGPLNRVGYWLFEMVKPCVTTQLIMQIGASGVRIKTVLVFFSFR